MGNSITDTEFNRLMVKLNLHKRSETLLLLIAMKSGANVEKRDGLWKFVYIGLVEKVYPIESHLYEGLEDSGLVVLGEDDEICISHLGAAFLNRYYES